MTPCQRCGEPVAADARFCPTCGHNLQLATGFPASFGRSSDTVPTPAPPKNSFQSCMSYFGGAVLAIILLVIVSKVMFPASPSPSPAADLATPDADPSAAPSSSPSAPIVISAADLWRAYDANEARAQDTYGPGPLRVTGAVRTVGLGFGGKPDLTLATPNDFMPVHVELLPADQPKALKLNKGDRVTVTCATATIALDSPFVEKCTMN